MIDNNRYLNTDIMFDTTNCVKAISDLANAYACSTEEVGNALKQVGLAMHYNDCDTMESISITQSDIKELEIRVEYLENFIKEMNSYEETNQFLRNIKW